MANHVMEEAFYNTQVARAAFFPTITLSGLVGWTNNGGGAIMNPGSLLLNAVGQLTQPIFQQGKLKANLKIAKLTQEDDSTYVLQHLGGSVLKVPKNGKWQKLPNTLKFKKK